MQITKDTSKEEILKLGEECNKCGHCCSHGTGFLIKEDYEKLAKHLNITVEELKEKHLEKRTLFGKEMHRPKTKTKPFGKCIFLNNETKLCTVHEVKPFQCKIGTCDKKTSNDIQEWFYLNFCIDPYDENSLKEWETRLTIKETIPGGKTQELK